MTSSPRRALTLLVLVACLLAPNSQSAEAQFPSRSLPLLAVDAQLTAANSKTFSTNFTLVNVSNSQTVTSTVSYTRPDGSPWPVSPAFASAVLPPGSSAILRQYDDPVMPAGLGSASLTLSNGFGLVVPVVQVLARGGQVASSGAYSNVATNRSLFVPLVVRNLNTASGLSNSQLAIYNPGTSAITATVTFLPAPGSPGSQYVRNNVAIPAGASFMYDVSGETNLVDGFFGSAQVTANDVNGQVSLVANLFSGPHQLYTFGGFTRNYIPGQDWINLYAVPLFMSRLTNGTSTTLAVQNMDGTTIPAGGLDITCTDVSATNTFTISNPADIPPAGAYYVNPVTDPTLPNNWYGSCVISPDTVFRDLAVLIQQRRPGLSDDAAAYQATIFSSNPGGTGGYTALVPLVARRLPNGFATAVTIQDLYENLDIDDNPVPATVNLRYIPVGGGAPIVVGPLTLPSLGILIRNHRLGGTGPQVEEALPDGWVGSLQITSDQEFTGFIQLTNTLALPGDNLMAHEMSVVPVLP